MHRAACLGFLVWLVVSASTVWAAPASAHASVVSSSPGDGSRVEVSPASLSFELNEVVGVVEGSPQLIDHDGVRHPFSAVRLENSGRRLVLVPADGLTDGAYLATARVLSADTHVVSLSIRFTVGSVTGLGNVPDDPGADAGTAQFLGIPSKWATYLGVALSAGLFVVARWVWPNVLGGRRFRFVYRVGATLLVAGLVGRVVLLAAQQSGGLSGISGSAVAAVASSRLGIAIAAAVMLSLACGIRPPGRGRGSDVTGYLQAASAIVAVTLGGHGGSTERWPVSFLGTGVHVYAGAIWLGGVLLLVLVQEQVPPLRRWHGFAAGHVALVAITGILLAFIQVDPVGALISTVYGSTLTVKVSVAVLTLIAGSLAYRRFSVGSAGGTEPLPVRRRPRILVAEAALAIVILAATSVLTSVVPAKDSYTTNVRTALDFGASEVLDVEIDSVRRGARSLTVRYRPEGATGGAPMPDVGVELSSAEANIARLPVELRTTMSADGELVWDSDGLIVPVAGQWKVTVRFEGGRGPKLASFYYEAL